ncbi:MAG: YfhO family protein [Isosphaeraceae bacterium]
MSRSSIGEESAWRTGTPGWGRGDLLALLGWSAAVLLIFWDAATLREAFFYFDVTEINYPYRDFLAQEMKLGRFSRWFPGLYCGMPLFSESQAGYLHPLKPLLYPWMATWKAFNLDTILSVWLTGLGAYGWLRRHVGPAGALTGAGIFGFSGFVWAHLIHTSMNNALTSVPFAVWALEWAWRSRRMAGVALGALAIAFQVFAGHLQDTILTAGLLTIYGLYRAATERTWAARRSVLGRTALLITLGMTLAAVQWVPSKELLDRSPRAGGLSWQQLTYGSWHPELLPTLVVREAYGTRARDTDWMDGFYPYHEMNAYLGLTAMALAVVGASASRDRWVAFWVILTGVGATLMLGRFTFVMDLAHKIPVVGSSRIPVRFHLWVSLAVAALAAVGVDRLWQGGGVRLRGAHALVLGMVVASVPILLAVYSPALTDSGRWTDPYHVNRFQWLREELTWGSLRTLTVTTLGLTAMNLAARSRGGIARRWACSTLPLVVIADLLGAHWRDAPTVPPSYWTQPPLSARVLKADPGLTRVFGLADRSAGEPGYASEPVDFLPIRDTLGWSLPPVWGLASSKGETPIIPRRSKEFTDHAGMGAVRFQLQSVSHQVTGRKSPAPFEKPQVAGTALIHRVPNVPPRARLVGRPFYARDEADAIAAIDLLGPRIGERLVVEDPDRPLPETASPTGVARITVDDPEHVVVETDSTDPAYLALADTFDPGWSATIDGTPAPIRPAWLTFRAVFLAPGSHRVEFRYRPAGFLTGLSVTSAGLLLALGSLLWRRPGPELLAEHGNVAWPERWPRWGTLAIAIVIVVSTLGPPSGGWRLQSRWDDSFHAFTWGAGIEAMRTVSPG